MSPFGFPVRPGGGLAGFGFAGAAGLGLRCASACVDIVRVPSDRADANKNIRATDLRIVFSSKFAPDLFWFGRQRAGVRRAGTSDGCLMRRSTRRANRG